MLGNEWRIGELIEAIEMRKKELRDAEYIVEFYPAMINVLENELFELIRNDE